MQIKKIIVVILSTVLCVISAVGCSSGKNAIGTTGSVGPDASEIVFSFADEKMTINEFRYYIYVAALETAYGIDPGVANDFSNFDWNQKDKDGKLLKDVIIDKAFQSALRDSIIIQKAEENGISLSESEKNENNQAIENAIKENGEENFLLNANAFGITDVKNYKTLANRMMGLEKAKTDISDNFSKYLVPDVDLSEWKSSENVTAQHVLISKDSEKFSDPVATANEVLEKAKAGEDFAVLIEQYNEDPGATEAGYTFGRGEMVKEFEEASFALDCGEISDVVQTEYGYHVIRRLAGLAELQNYWLSQADYEKNDEALSKISIKEIMDSAYRAQTKLQNLNQTQTAGN